MHYRSQYSNFLIILLILITIPVTSVFAEVATEAEMNNVCQNWLTLSQYSDNMWNDMGTPSIIGQQEIRREDGALLGICYDIAPIGFVVVPVIKDIPPIKVHSDENNIDMSETEGTAALIKDILISKIENYEFYNGSIGEANDKRAYGYVDQSSRDHWAWLASVPETFNNTPVPLKSAPIEEQVGPLLTTRWDQREPYNNYCPLGAGGRCVVGCVATAAAQILWYWQWPPAGSGEYSYLWPGDNSCDGFNTPGRELYADFSDPYYYDKYNDHDLAELNYEVAVAYNMQFGACGSGTWLQPGIDMLPKHFRYKDQMTEAYRGNYVLPTWFELFKEEINAARPMHYGILMHSIVIDGWKTFYYYRYYHSNYGWGGANNAWFAVDDLPCAAEGCSYMTEYMIRGIEPDDDVWLDSDTLFGSLPLEVSFTGTCKYPADSWIWDFGDGVADTTTEPACSHIYTEPGVFDATLTVLSGIEEYSVTRDNIASVVSDTIWGNMEVVNPGDMVEYIININNHVPLDYIKIPIDYSGPLQLNYLGWTTEGCRTDYIPRSNIVQVYDNSHNNQIALTMRTLIPDEYHPKLEPGSGPLIKILFEVVDGELYEFNEVKFNEITLHSPEISNGYYVTDLFTRFGVITIDYRCGDINKDYNVDILDITTLIDHKFRSVPLPQPADKADVNADGEIDIIDIIYLIDYKFNDGIEPECG